MIPSPWVAVILTLGAFRALRLLAWDDLPPIVRVRAWVLGEQTHRTGSSNSLSGLTSEVPATTVSYRRPLLAHLWFCPFCLGFWLSIAVYLAWIFEPRITLYIAAPFALSATIGLLAKNLDP